jgi:hypothetical protein
LVFRVIGEVPDESGHDEKLGVIASFLQESVTGRTGLNTYIPHDIPTSVKRSIV